MGIVLITAFFLLIGPAALIWGADSRSDERNPRRPRAMRLFSHTPVAWRHAVHGRERIVIRRAVNGDDRAVFRLAGLADQPAPPAPLLLAEADGVLVAAVSTVTGAVVSDPFVATADVVALLRLRADQLDRAA